MKDKIKWSDLPVYIRLGVIGGWLYLAIIGLSFLFGFFLGLAFY